MKNGQIDRLILNDVTGDLWNYGVLDDVKNLAANYSSIKTLVTTDSSGNTTTKTTVDDDRQNDDKEQAQREAAMLEHFQRSCFQCLCCR